MNGIHKEMQALTPPQRAELIYRQARAELSDRLWRAALGGGDTPQVDRRTNPEAEAIPLDTLLTLFEPARPGPVTASGQPSTLNGLPQTLGNDAGMSDVVSDRRDGPDRSGPVSQPMNLGANAGFGPAIAAAASRTGLPASALAAIVNAEAAKKPDGSWLTYSRNPRSSAAGLGQFLSSTWEGLASVKGTWLNARARSEGWIREDGRVLPSARSALLQLRYDPEASINTVADYASRNLAGLRRAGVPVGDDTATIAQSAYLGHHLGLGDAIKFAKGDLDPARARVLLCAQIGTAKAGQQIAEAGSAIAAHRTWYLDYVQRQLRTDRFTA